MVVPDSRGRRLPCADMDASTASTIGRRNFLVAGAAALAGCSSDDRDPGAPDAVASTDGPAAGLVELVEAPPWQDTRDPFTLGVGSGDPTDTAVVLWTRLAPDPTNGGGMIDESGALRGDIEIAVDVATDERFADLVMSDIAVAEGAHAHTVHFDAIGLRPDTQYWYRFRLGRGSSPVGRTRTAPDTATTTDSFTIAVTSCQRFEDGYYNAWSDIASDEDVDLVVFLGDYIYEGASRPADGTHPRSVTGPECETLDQYRDRYAQYRSDENLRAAHAWVPWAVVWDDHEVENNYADRTSENDSSDDIAAQERFAERRAAAYTAWWEHQPVRLPAPTDDTLRIRRTQEWGRLAELWLIDTRQDRSDQACGDTDLSFDPACEEVADPSRHMMSEDDEAWLTGGISNSEHVWNLIGNQTVMTDLRVGEAVLNYDQWDGYPVQRERILNAIADSGRTNVVVLTGDIHVGGLGLLTVDRDGAPTTVATELVGTSISSGASFPSGIDDQITELLPDVRYFDVGHRGWCKFTLRPDSASADYRVVEDNLVDGSPVATAARFDLSPGTPGATQVQ